jgi:glutathione S-transferase
MLIDTSAYPNLMAHNARVEARPAVQEALQHEKLS